MIARIKKLFKKRTEWEMMCPDYREYFLDCLLAYHSYLLMTGDWHSDIRAHFLKGFPPEKYYGASEAWTAARSHAGEASRAIARTRGEAVERIRNMIRACGGEV